jgi:6-phosphogluconolactonase
MRFRFGALFAMVAAAAVVPAAAASASPGPGSGARFNSLVVGELYVNDNTSPVNTVAGFYRHADGTLTTIPGSPFVVGGSGTGSATASQGSLQLSSDGRYLLAVDAGSSRTSVLQIEHDGTLQIAGGGPVSSNGVDPVSIAVHNQLVYVANAGATSPNYTGFWLSPFGQLQAIPGSTVSLPPGSQPGDVLFNGDGTKLVGTRVATSMIDSFTVGWNGLLNAAPGSPFAAQGVGPFGSEFRPWNPTQLFVSNAHNGGSGTVSAFSDGFNGTLSSIGSSPFPDDETAPCWVAISPDGRYLFAVNTGNSTISSYSIGWNGSLSLIGSTPFKSTSVGAEDAGISPDGSTLWVVEAGADAVAAFSIQGGTLTELASSPTPGPTNVKPSGIAITGLFG